MGGSLLSLIEIFYHLTIKKLFKKSKAKVSTDYADFVPLQNMEIVTDV
jgi:hypothetical protein